MDGLSDLDGEDVFVVVDPVLTERILSVSGGIKPGAITFFEEVVVYDTNAGIPVGTE